MSGFPNLFKDLLDPLIPPPFMKENSLMIPKQVEGAGSSTADVNIKEKITPKILR
jgi:hypothetical protein